MELANQKVRSHLQARIFLGDVDIGSARSQSFEAEHDFGTEAVHGVGDFVAAEHVHLKFAGSINLDAFMIRENDLVDLGLAALSPQEAVDNGTYGAESHNILNLGVLTVTVYTEDDVVLRQYHGVVIRNYTERINAGQICGERATMFFQFCTSDKSVSPIAA